MFDPIDGLAAGERKFLRTRAKALADRIPPDVAGDILDLVRGPENMVVITHFPKTAAVRFAKREGGTLFEDADEFAQVRTVVKTLGENMKVVRHQAIRMQQERTCSGALQQQSKDALGRGWVSEKRGTEIAADGDEIRLTPEIVLRRKTSDSAMERHTTK
jgi:LmbE family N-acetylglucosaminyl deacetylase